MIKARKEEVLKKINEIKAIKDPKEKERVFDELLRTDPKMIEEIVDIAEEEARGLTEEDKHVLSLGVSNGFRAAYIVKTMKSLNQEEKKKLFEDYLEKKII